MNKQIAILGSTGSIGIQALNVIEALGPDYKVAALSAHSNVQLLAKQAKLYRPKFIAITDADYVKPLQEAVCDLDVEVLAGPDSLTEIARLQEVDIVLAAVVGAVGLDAALAAAQKGKRLAIANKEPLVIAGELLTNQARQSGATIIPVDSEHSAIFQAMQSGSAEQVNKIILTASGGPFRETSVEDIQNASIEQALEHPVWNMGPKITVDSATMMNKALEVIEAHWLFDIEVDDIEILIHPESIIHSLVEFIDGSVIAQLGRPDMSIPIQYALTYPDRLTWTGKNLRLDEIGKLTFDKPDFEKFPALSLGYQVARTQGTAPAVFNAANEVSVKEFLAGRVGFADIVKLIEHCLNRHTIKASTSLEELLDADAWARNEVKKKIAGSVRV